MAIDPETFVRRVRAGESLAGLDLTEADHPWTSAASTFEMPT